MTATLTAPKEFEKLVDLFKVGKKYTIFSINGLAITCKKEIQIIEYTLDQDFPVFKDRGKRKCFVLTLWRRSYQSAPLEPFEGAVFEGWDLPIKCDSDVYGAGGAMNGIMRGNACYNFVGDLSTIKALIETRQLNPFFEVQRSVCTGVNNDQEIPIFPELYRGGCAPMDLMIEKTEKKQDEVTAAAICADCKEGAPKE